MSSGYERIQHFKSTTTFKVVDMEMTEDEYVDKHVAAMAETGFSFGDDIEEQKDISRSDIQVLLEAANGFPVGMILERRGNDIQPRPQFSWSFPPMEDY